MQIFKEYKHHFVKPYFKKMFRVSVVPLILIFLLNNDNCVLGNGNGANMHLNSDFGVQNESPKSLYSVTRYPFPQFREISPCSCDVTMNKCDVGCCCDTECPKQNNNNITCIPGLLGGNDVNGKILRENCSHWDMLYGPSWLSLFCIQRHNSPYLGLFL